jgi:hypothetical protein
MANQLITISYKAKAHYQFYLTPELFKSSTSLKETEQQHHVSITNYVDAKDCSKKSHKTCNTARDEA